MAPASKSHNSSHAEWLSFLEDDEEKNPNAETGNVRYTTNKRRARHTITSDDEGDGVEEIRANTSAAQSVTYLTLDDMGDESTSDVDMDSTGTSRTGVASSRPFTPAEYANDCFRKSVENHNASKQTQMQYQDREPYKSIPRRTGLGRHKTWKAAHQHSPLADNDDNDAALRSDPANTVIPDVVFDPARYPISRAYGTASYAQTANELQAPTEDTPFNELDLAQRKAVYRKYYTDAVIELKDIKTPPMCAQFPELRAEIMFHCLTKHTFRCQIWLNYDTAEQKFFADDRVELCGKMRVSRTVRIRLQEWEEEYELRHVDFEICTAFNTLGLLILRTNRRQSYLEFQSHIKYQSHNMLMAYLEEQTRELNRALYAAGIGKLTLRVLDHCADALVCRPGDYAEHFWQLQGFIQPKENFREWTRPHSHQQEKGA